ncbi:MAG: hypothetical protein K0R51_1811 [Cytophagaceae bacterium]|jgi:hypothetical protein|nr:hypothetical protein [Cytophagaceae bacterium]
MQGIFYALHIFLNRSSMINRTAIFLIALLTSCSYSLKDFYLNAEEKSFFTSFKAGDTIYYENLNHDFDTLLIIGIDSNEKREHGVFMAKPASHSVFVSSTLLPVNPYATRVQEQNRVDTLFDRLLGIYKLPVEKKVEYVFSFKEFFETRETLDSLYLDTLRINGQAFSEYYIIESSVPDKRENPHEIDRLIWSKNAGLLAYRNRKGEYWTKVASKSYSALNLVE